MVSTCTEDSYNCQNGGVCILATEEDGKTPANYCQCPQETTGTLCHGLKDTSTCSEDGDKCQNGGVCILATNQKDGKTPANYCQCPEGTSGTICHGKDVCPLKCQHGSSCRHYTDESHQTLGADGVSSTEFYCECVGNYKGMMCEVPFETCPKIKDENPLECLFGGECVSPTIPTTEYMCKCPNGRSGNNCEQGQTSTLEDYNGSCFANDDCNNGGLCVREHDSKTTQETGMESKHTYCLCVQGWGGENCETGCESLNCQHGSSCRFESPDDVTHANDSTDSGAFCECVNGNHKGMECEIAVTTCPGDNDMECLYGGSCVGSEDDGDGNFYNCECPPGRKGKHCEVVYTATTSNPGSNGIYNNDNLSSSPVPVPLPVSSASSTNLGSVFITFCLAAVILALIIILPLTLFCLQRQRRQRNNLDSQQAVAEESLDGTFAKSDGDELDEVKIDTNTDGDDIFDYDTQGVVDVILERCDSDEPPELHKDKQIV